MGKDGHIDVLKLSDEKKPGYVYYDVRCLLCGREWKVASQELLRGVSCRCIAYNTEAVRARSQRNTTKGVLYMAVTADKYELPVAVASSAVELASLIGYEAQRIREKVCRKKISDGREQHGGYCWGNVRFYRVKEDEECSES